MDARDREGRLAVDDPNVDAQLPSVDAFAIEPRTALWGSSSSLEADFNGDGYADLAIGVPGEGPSAAANSGAVNVLYGTASGLSAADDQLWHKSTPGVLGIAEAGDGFGGTLAAGDFNGDGFADLAISSPREAIGSIDNAGAVNVLYGSTGGLTAVGDQRFHQNTAGVPGTAAEDDFMGEALASGDFDGDGYDDLAIGIPHEDVAGRSNAGAVNVLYGSAGGLSASTAQLWDQDSPGIVALSQAGDLFGAALAAGDFDGDGHDELAIGVPGEDFGWPLPPGSPGTAPWPFTQITDGGSVNVLRGSDSGLTAQDSQTWHQESGGIGGILEASDQFGRALASGDFDGDGYADLVIGVPYEDVGELVNAGVVNVIYGASGGLDSSGNQYWHQDSYMIEDTAEAYDAFGLVLAAGDFNGDERDDLAVGVPYEDLERVTTISNAGLVNVMYGSSSGISREANQVWSQDTPGIRGASDTHELFGAALTAGDYDADGRADLAVGVPLDDLGPISDAGVVNVIRGAASGLVAAGDQLWHQNVSGVNGVAGQGDRFGAAVR